MVAAEAGDAEAEYSLGKCYLKGDGVEQDIGTALIRHQSYVVGMKTHFYFCTNKDMTKEEWSMRLR